ncbi:MAG: lipocalin family protein [Desulfurivibrio sp.]|nr:lipocalin family protein [Desulfurivibrio sp.]MBU4034645.1 lipocalin family protein [Pseudomonadota bacterium]
MSNRHLAVAVLAAFLLSSCYGCASRTTVAPLATVSYVDLARYSGTWHELARLPMWFQRDCLQSRAEYTLLSENEITVVNSCPTAGGGNKKAHGIAMVVDEQTNAKLTVRFDNWFSRIFPGLTTGDYWILWLDPAYQTVLVGTPDRKFLWILARTPSVDRETFNQLSTLAQELGFATEQLIVFQHDR